MSGRMKAVCTLAVWVSGAWAFGMISEEEREVRVASYNVALNRFNAGDLISDLTAGDSQAAKVAEVIQRTAPDVILLNEIDYDAAGEALQLFREQYLEVSQNGAEPASYPYWFLAPSNTGIASGEDFDNTGAVDGPNDAFGFGFFEGQYAMALLSKYPIRSTRTFQKFLWKDMPGGLFDIVDPADNTAWFSQDALDVFRLSSKSHWDVEIDVDGASLHVLASHPTPPVFDGDEDRNGRRNHDEIRFWKDYVAREEYIYDDDGVFGGLADGHDYFVVCGDLNADPYDGDSYDFAARQLTENDNFNDATPPTSAGGVSAAEHQAGFNLEHDGDPAQDTADFGFGGFNETTGLQNPDVSPGNLRADYALPSVATTVKDAQVFWLTPDDDLWPLGEFPDSDHRLVYIDAVIAVVS